MSECNAPPTTPSSPTLPHPHGHTLFICSYLERGDVVSTTMATTQQHVAMVTQLKTFVARLDEEEGKFNVFWVHHKAVLDHKVYLGYFLRSVEKVGPYRIYS